MALQAVEWDMLLFFAAMFAMIEASAGVCTTGYTPGPLNDPMSAAMALMYSPTSPRNRQPATCEHCRAWHMHASTHTLLLRSSCNSHPPRTTHLRTHHPPTQYPPPNDPPQEGQ